MKTYTLTLAILILFLVPFLSHSQTKPVTKGAWKTAMRNQLPQVFFPSIEKLFLIGALLFLRD